MIGEFKQFRFSPIEFEDLYAEIREPLGRFYKLPDRFSNTGEPLFVPSITTVLSILSKDAIEKWRKKVGEEEANRISTMASERGTRIHEMCEHYIAGEVDKFQDMSYADLITFKTLKPIIDHYIDDVIVQEAPLYSFTHKVAGRTDVIGNYGGELSIIDFKTSTKQKKKEWITSYFLQGAGYSIMYEELTGVRIENIVIIIACDQGEPQIFVEKRSDHEAGFLETRARFRELHGV